MISADDSLSQASTAPTEAEIEQVINVIQCDGKIVVIKVAKEGKKSSASIGQELEDDVAKLLSHLYKDLSIKLGQANHGKRSGEKLTDAYERRSDGKKSNPDFEMISRKQKVLVDAKNYDVGLIRDGEVVKLLEDMRVRRAAEGVLILGQNSCLHPDAWKMCQAHGIYITRLDRDGDSYQTHRNMKHVENVVDAALRNFEPPEKLFTKSGQLDQRSAFVRRGNDPEDADLKFTKEGKIDKRTKEWKSYEAYHDKKETQKNRTINYDQEEAERAFHERRSTRREEKKAQDLAQEAQIQKPIEDVNIAMDPHGKMTEQGEPDMRDLANRQVKELTKDGLPDQRFSANHDNIQKAEDIDGNAKAPEEYNVVAQTLEDQNCNIATDPHGRMTESGEPDMRDLVNREVKELTKDGLPDQRFSCNQNETQEGEGEDIGINANAEAQEEDNVAPQTYHNQTTNIAADPQGTMTESGELDMRDTSNREDPTLTKDGEPDMRFSCNQNNIQEAEDQNENVRSNQDTDVTTNAGQNLETNVNVNADTNADQAEDEDEGFDVNVSRNENFDTDTYQNPDADLNANIEPQEEDDVAPQTYHNQTTNIATDPQGMMTESGEPDMRDTSNREDPTLTKSGEPDMRFGCNRNNTQEREDVGATTNADQNLEASANVDIDKNANQADDEEGGFAAGVDGNENENLDANTNQNVEVAQAQEDDVTPQTYENQTTNIAADPQGMMTEAGEPDMRDTSNREDPTLREDGEPDMRFGCNQNNAQEVEGGDANINASEDVGANTNIDPNVGQNEIENGGLDASENFDTGVQGEANLQTSDDQNTNIAADPQGTMTESGEPDMRDTSNREDPTLTKDGKPDMRFSCNQEAAGEA